MGALTWDTERHQNPTLRRQNGGATREAPRRSEQRAKGRPRPGLPRTLASRGPPPGVAPWRGGARAARGGATSSPEEAGVGGLGGAQCAPCAAVTQTLQAASVQQLWEVSDLRWPGRGPGGSHAGIGVRKGQMQGGGLQAQPG